VKAAVVGAYGEPPEFADFDEPRARSDGQEVVEVLAAGLNPVDLHIASGSFYAGSPPLPYVPGREGVARAADGRRVYFDTPVPPFGSLAQRTLIDSSGAVELPDGVEDALAIACGVAGLAAWLSLQWRAQLKPGETVLVLGASGPVGQIAIQAALIMGAGRVIAAARSERGLERARELGAAATVELAGDRDAVVGALREAAPDGVDVTIDPVWGPPAEAAIEVMAVRGRHVQLGAAAAATATLPSGIVRGRLLAILGHTSYQTPAEVRRTAFEQMLAHAAAGELRVDAERIPLADAAVAWERQRSAPGAKLVLVP
jgi:NADPH2:quinone reductase